MSSPLGAGVDRDWWRTAVVYQIYPRSFADSTGDGIGDLAGIESRVPYLRRLGVDAVWLSPFYPSPLVDGGYDVADHRDVDPRLGTLADFDRLVVALHAAGIRVLVDIVPNHTSDRHPWFRTALDAEPGSRERERYLFRDGRGPRGEQPPNDWESMFGGPAWERTRDGQWYLHLFATEQPDLNWDNREVREDLLRTLRFWADRGVDGFRVDVAHGLTKDLSEPYRPQAQMRDPLPVDGAHPWWDRDEVHEVYAEWRRLFDEYDPPLTAVAEAWVPAHRWTRYASPDGLGQAFDFGLVGAAWDAREFRAVVRRHRRLLAGTDASSTWVLSNHDVPRPASRYSRDPEEGRRRARAAVLLLLALPGSAYLYQGEELGLPEVADIPAHQRQDPVFLRTGGAQTGRDGCRVPLPWTTDGPSLGFGAGAPHLPQPPSFAGLAVEAQEGDPESTLHLVREALRLRHELQRDEQVTVLPEQGTGSRGLDGESEDTTLHLVRTGGWHAVTNFSDDPVPLPPGEVLLLSAPAAPGVLPGASTAWLRLRGD